MQPEKAKAWYSAFDVYTEGAAMELDIRAFGAIGDGRTLNTLAIQAAIDEAATQQAVVVVADGIYLSGALFLKQGMALEIRKGATLLGSPNLADYPIQQTRFEGRLCTWPVGFLNGMHLSDVKVYGEGTLDGNGFPFWKQFWDARQAAIASNAAFSNRDIMRPRLCYFEDCDHIHLEGLTLQNSAFWNLHLYLSHNITIKALTIQAPHEGVRAASSDAIDIDACSNVTISDCTFSTDDDCVCIKGGKGPQAHSINPPTENIVVERCRFGFGHGVITLGSEAALVSNVVVRNCVVEGENSLVRCKFRSDTYQRFENILFEGITMQGGGWLFDVRPWVSRQDEILGEGLPSCLSNLVVRNINAIDMQSPGVLGKGCSDLLLEGIRLEQIVFTSKVGATGRLIRADEVEKQETLPGILAYETNADIRFVEVLIDGVKQGNV